jgi:hypothetical protein
MMSPIERSLVDAEAAQQPDLGRQRAQGKALAATPRAHIRKPATKKPPALRLGGLAEYARQDLNL